MRRIGGLLGLLFVRLLLRDALLRSPWMQKHKGKWEALDRAVDREGAALIVGLLRLSPAIPYMPSTTLLGLTDVPLMPFLVGTALGLVPFTIIYAYLGSAGRQLFAGGLRNPRALALTIFGLATTLVLTAKINGVASKALADVQS